jgi:hypothetical protein
MDNSSQLIWLTSRAKILVSPLRDLETVVPFPIDMLFATKNMISRSV